MHRVCLLWHSVHNVPPWLLVLITITHPTASISVPIDVVYLHHALLLLAIVAQHLLTLAKKLKELVSQKVLIFTLKMFNLLYPYVTYKKYSLYCFL